MILETERLVIQPLSYDQLLNYTALNNALEDCLGLNLYPRSVPDELKEALEQVILPQVAEPGRNPLYATLWTVIEKEQKLMVADLCFKGAPNAQGEVEIGYGTYPDFQGRGYMTEAIRALTQWAFRQPGVKAILAETDEANVASHKTLSRNCFSVYKQVDKMRWWRLDKQGLETEKPES